MSDVLAERPARNYLSQDDYWTWSTIAPGLDAVLSSRALSRTRRLRVSAGDIAEEFELPDAAEDVIMRLIARVQDLINLPSGWDSYGARRVRPEAALHALKVYAFFAQGLPAPALVPTVSGGVQLEWHLGSIDVEIEVRGRGDLQVFFDDESSGETFEEPILSPREYNRLESLASRLLRTGEPF